MTCPMVFQSPHGRLYYSFMLLDRDIVYFILFYQQLIKSMQCCHMTQ